MFTLLLMFGSLCDSPSEGAEPETPLLPPNAYLVQARVIRVSEAEDREAEFVIEHVYAGDPALVEQKFLLTDYLPRSGSRINTKYLCPRQVGEVGLWWVGIQKDTSSGENQAKPSLFSYHDLAHALPRIYRSFPVVLKGGKPQDLRCPPIQYGDLASDPYDFGTERTLQWAEAIEKVTRASGDDNRIKILETYVKSDNAPLSAWAISTLSRFLDPEGKKQILTSSGAQRNDCELVIRHPSVAKLLRGDVKAALENYAENRELTIYAQAELDRVLMRIDGDDWLASNRRRNMLFRWNDVTDPIDRYFINTRLHELDK
ncbi:MAG TPA: hypothetical protein VMS17_11200 [Gemmataceae bacterium]|nr:hypothetical protein [Gemmataceae bacterium]